MSSFLELTASYAWAEDVVNLPDGDGGYTPWPDETYLCEIRTRPGGALMATVTVDKTNIATGVLTLRLDGDETEAARDVSAFGVLNIITDDDLEIIGPIEVRVSEHVTETA